MGNLTIRERRTNYVVGTVVLSVLERIERLYLHNSMDSLAIVTGRQAEYVFTDTGRWFDAILKV